MILLVIGAISTVFGLLLLFIFPKWITPGLLNRHWILVTAKRTSSRRLLESLSFTAENGNEYQLTIRSLAPWVTDVPVYYDPDNPNRAAVGSFAYTRWMEGLALVVCGIVLLIFGLFVFGRTLG